MPELDDESEVKYDRSGLVNKVKRGQEVVGNKAVPILIGPNTIVGLSRGTFNHSAMVERLLPAYVAALEALKELGVPEVQIHEPILTTTHAINLTNDVVTTYNALCAVGVDINLVVPYDDVDEEVYKMIVELPVSAISLDFCGVPGATSGNATATLIGAYGFPKTKRLGVGCIDGRAIWKDTNNTAINLLTALRTVLGADQPMSVQTSISLQHVPVDVELEKKEDWPEELLNRLAFAKQKLDELVVAATTVNTPVDTAPVKFTDLSAFSTPGTGHSGITTEEEESIGNLSIPLSSFSRREQYTLRRPQQLQFHAFPTTTIGSTPQTPTIRRTRLAYKKGLITEAAYREAMAAEIGYSAGVQDALGLDVLVHGEPERTDMVEFFGVKLDGFAFTSNGWVQSYGSRYVRPPIIAGDVKRVGAMTVVEYQLASNVTTKPVKGMLTGPVTILNWSFPRKDVSRKEQAYQIALALREEVVDLEKAGCRILQVDEPAIREGLPLKQRRWQGYLEWAVKAFRLATGAAGSGVQVVTHLCYSQFEDILAAIDGLDADVLTIENSRSNDEMLYALSSYGYSRDLGPGVYDIHSPVVPSVDFLVNKLRAFLHTGVLGGEATRLWANPDCGLKTRKWEEVVPSLKAMVEAARIVREEWVAAGGADAKWVASGVGHAGRDGEKKEGDGGGVLNGGGRGCGCVH